MEGRDSDSRVWRRNERGEPELGLSTGRVRERVGRRDRVIKMMWGPKPPARVRPVRPVAHTGQTGPGQTDKEIVNLWFPI